MSNDKWGWLEIIPLLIILSLALFVRAYNLTAVPPAFNGDEANIALDAQDILAGNLSLITPREGGEGALFAYLMALSFGLFGVSIEVARGMVVVISLLGIALAYGLVWYLAHPHLGRHPAVAMAALVSLYLTVASWHVSHSRIAFPTVLGILVQLACFIALWVALRTRRPVAIVCAGIMLGLTAYVYVPFKLTPFILLIFFGVDGLLRWRNKPFLRTHWPMLLTIAILSTLFYGPLLILYAGGGLREGTGAFTIFSSFINKGDLWGTLWRTILGNLAGFLPFIRQVQGVPLAKGLDNLSLIFFLIGLVVALKRSRQPVFLFLVIWWAVMLLPSIISPEGAMPHLRRAMGTVVPAFTLASLGLVFPLAALKERYPRWGVALVVSGFMLAAIPLYTLAQQTYYNYYLNQLHNEAAALLNHSYDFDLAETMIAEGNPQTAYILPVDFAAGALFPESATLAFAYQNEGQASYAYVWDDEETLFEEVRALSATATRLGVLQWRVSKHTGADPKHIFHYIGHKWGQPAGTTEHQYFKLDYFDFDTQGPAIALASLQSADISFEDQFRLTGLAWEQATETNRPLWAELTWRKTGETPHDYQVALWLVDMAGHRVAQIDRPLLNSRWHQSTSLWAVGDEIRDYYLLPLDPTILPGSYHLQAVLYAHTDGNERRLAPALPNVGADLAAPLGSVQILPPSSPPTNESTDIPPATTYQVDEQLRLAGVAPGFTPPVRPGDGFTLRLWWHLVAQPTPAWRLTVVARDQTGADWLLSETQVIGSETYPLSGWGVGDTFQQFVDVHLPAEMPQGDYTLGLKLETTTTNFSARRTFDLPGTPPLQVIGRPRIFTPPSVTHPREASFGDAIALLGYDFDWPSLEADAQADLILYWQAEQAIPIPYKVFIHLLDAQGQIIAQTDREPRAGEAPTTSWLPGEVIIDPVLVLVPDPAAVQQIVIGLYNPGNGQRLILAGGEDRLLLTERGD